MRKEIVKDVLFLTQKSNNITEYLPEVQSYFTKSELVIILSVPHAIGDYIEIKMK